MKKLSLLAMLLGLGLFSVAGCESGTKEAAEARIDAAGERAEAVQAAKENAVGNVSADKVKDEVNDANDATAEAADKTNEAVTE